MESEEILKLSKRIYRFLHRRNWSPPEIEDLHSYMLLKALDGTSKNHNSFRFIYFDAVKSLFPIKERDNDTVENNIDRIVYEYDFDTKIQVQEILKRIPKNDRICILKFMYDQDKSSSVGLDMRRRRIFTEIREREEF